MSDNLSVRQCAVDDDERDRQQYDLNWNYHDVVLLNGINNFQISGCLTDITLAADNRSIKAHKLILASCSPYFFQLFKEMENVQHPVVILQDVAYDDICSIVSYMYRGKCIVSSSRLQEVLSVAKLLKIRGLCDFPHADKQQELQSHRRRRCLPHHPHPHPPSNPHAIRQQSNSTSLFSPSIIPNCNNLPDLVHLEQCPASAVKRNGANGAVQNVETKTEEDRRAASQSLVSLPLSSHPFSVSAAAIGPASASPTRLEKAHLLRPAESVDRELVDSKVIVDAESSAAAAAVDVQTRAERSLFSHLPPPPALPLPLTPIDAQEKHAIVNTSTTQLLKKLKHVDSICFVCGKQLSNQYNLRVHLETHQSGYYACQSCPHISRSKDALRKHVSYRHSAGGTVSKRKLQQK